MREAGQGRERAEQEESLKESLTLCCPCLRKDLSLSTHTSQSLDVGYLWVGAITSRVRQVPSAESNSLEKGGS